MSQSEETFLVVVHPSHDNHIALERAIKSAGLRESKPRLHLFVSPDVELMRRKEREAGVSMEQEELARIQSIITDAGLEFEMSFHWTRDIENNLIRASESFNADMLFYPFSGRAVRKHSWFSTAKWDLLRKSKCPIMLVRPDQKPLRKVILAAVNVQTSMPELESLNRRIIARTNRLATAYGATAKFVNAYSDLSDYPDVEKIKKLSGTSGDDLIVETGDADEVVENTASKQKADLVIIGTSSKHDIDTLFLGSTTEQIARQVSCDVLIVT